MKTVKITLRQAGNGLFQVEKFSNTVQLSIGMTIPSERVAEWCAMSRVQVDCIGLVEQRDDEMPLLDDCKATPVSAPDTMAMIRASDAASTGENENSNAFVAAREFDKVMFELAPVAGFADDGLIAAASEPDPGNDNLGTIGIQGKIKRDNALAILRRRCAKEFGLLADEIGRVAYRAQALPVLQKFAQNLMVQPF